MDYVHLASTFFYYADPSLNCQSCVKKTQQRIRDERKGCNVAPPKPVAKHRMYTFYRCPSNFRSEFYYQVILMHEKYEKGLLPFSGGILEQPAKFIDLMAYVADLKSEHYNDMKKKSEKQQARTRAKNGRK